MILTGITRPAPEPGHFNWFADDFGGHVFEASFVDAEQMERDQ